MKANELRLGNFVWNDTQNIPVVVDIKIISEQLYRQKTGNGMWKPITITEEWLIKFNFSRDEIGYWGKENSIYSFVDRGDLGFMLVIADIEYKETYVKQVHQLQNLWFALQDEELTIKQQ